MTEKNIAVVLVRYKKNETKKSFSQADACPQAAGQNTGTPYEPSPQAARKVFPANIVK